MAACLGAAASLKRRHGMQIPPQRAQADRCERKEQPPGRTIDAFEGNNGLQQVSMRRSGRGRTVAI